MREIIVSPFSNSTIRDWPADHYRDFIGQLLVALPPEVLIRVTGTASQWQRASNIVRPHDPSRVSNDCGRFAWTDLVARLSAAACLIGNNSGMAHLAASFGVLTVCVFGGSHQRLEWYPRGPKVHVLSREIGCSPCHLDHNGLCLFEKRCLSEIEPTAVARATTTLLGFA